MSGRAESDLLVAPNSIALGDVEQALVKLRLEAPYEVDGGTPDEQPVTRACMSNLIVYCDGPAQAEALPAQLTALSGRHPARVISLVGEDPSQTREIESFVSAELTTVRKRRQISIEQIKISASPDARDRLASAARPLLIGDLPTTLWWNSTVPPSNRGDLFRELGDMADIVAYDSRGWRDPRMGMIETADWALAPENDKLVTDLAWMRLRFWRRLMAETLAPDVMPGALRHIERIDLEHGPHALPMVWLYVGWLAHHLDWHPTGGKVISQKELSMRFESPNGPLRVSIKRDDHGPSELRRAIVTSRGAGPTASPVTVEFESIDASRMVVRVDDGQRSENCIAAPIDPPIILLAWQLANRAGQPDFRDALDIGRIMAKEIES